MTYEQLPLIMLRALALTVIIEGSTAWIMGVRNVRDQGTVALANILTNPLVVSLGAAAMYYIGPRALRPVTLTMEVLVFIAEGYIYKRRITCKADPYVLSLACNLSSYLIGEMLNRFVF